MLAVSSQAIRAARRMLMIHIRGARITAAYPRRAAIDLSD